MNTFYYIQMAFVAGAMALFAETPRTADTGDAAHGMVVLARELQLAPDSVLERSYATVESSLEAPALEFADRPIAQKRSNYVVERASRITYKLRSADLGKPVIEEDRTAIVWTKAYAARIRDSSFSRTFNDPRALVIGRPLQQGKLVSFKQALEANPGEMPDMVVLPSGSIGMLKEALQWRRANAVLFGAEAENEDVIAKLRTAAKSRNPYQRVVSLFRLKEVHRITPNDIESALGVATSAIEVAATTLVILRHQPEEMQSLVNASLDTTSNGFVLDGVALGAATHFLTLPDSDNLLRKAITSQLTPLAPSDDHLKKTVSFPLLQQLGRQASEQARQRSPMLSRMLNVTGASTN